ncbi:MAG TPA: lysine--tRNA ligase [Roseiflexaceae bacterium]|nr:lysine--tRNA ligase [Roseiflexaceae bacterium]
MEDELITTRRAKLQRLAERGLRPYPDGYPTTHTVREAVQLPDGAEVSLAGRLMSRRSFGKLVFGHVQDRSGRGQISFKQQGSTPDAWWLQENVFDMGDLVGVTGTMWTTKTGERTLDVREAALLSKAIRPMPEKWHGLKDVEQRYRQRYLDLISNEETRARFLARARVITLIRSFLDQHGFLEVETPILQAASSGAAARPFITHHNALDMDLYLRISPETYLKRLVVGGFERVYEIGRNFRNEGLDASHLQEFTMLEWYAGYWNYRDNMQFVRALIQHVIRELHGTTTITYEGVELDFGGEWAEVSYRDALLHETGIDILALSTHEELAAAVRQRVPELNPAQYPSFPALVDALYKRTVRPKLVQPTFLLHHPTELVPLARRNDDNPRILDMFQVVVNSWEIVKAYSELVDPQDQRQRMLEQLEYREQGDDETMMLEDDYIECMEYGMPPNSGLGLGIDRFVALLTNASTLRDVVLFPNMRALPPQ